MNQSKLFSLNWRDTLRSFAVAFFTFLAYYIQDSVIPGLNYPEEVKAMISGAIGYLVKNFITSPDSKVIGTRPKDRD
ncbi:hypothetical protein [uncultured Empedobacter sp.]|uniref:hypothetical protein n=1 Tax=uncultured Empedobacter sp. TaxID=410844 RepID=UPI0025EBE381|nr:hypothetical protein [uncultured Empedobacter sp.]